MADDGFDPMIVFLWFGFVGAWLLFAGPVYQAALELREQGFDPEEGDAFRERIESLPKPPRLNAWWWLLPPVAYVMNQRRTQHWRDEAFKLLDADALERFIAFQNKAVGWLVVGAGALAIAIKESAELISESDWSWWWLIPMLVVPFLLSVGFTASRMRREGDLKSQVGGNGEPGEPAPRRRRSR